MATTLSPNTRSPFAHGAIAGHQHRAALVAPRYELEEQVRSVGFQRQVAEFIHDQQLRLRVVHQTLLQPAYVMRLGQRRNECRRRGEQRRVAVLDRFAAERDGKMRFAHAGRPEQQHASPLPTQRQVASSRTSFASSDGCAANSKPSSVRTNGNLAIELAIWMRRSSLRATSASHNSFTRVEQGELAPGRPVSSRLSS